MSNYCKECYKKQEQIEQLQAENKELKSSLVSQASIIFTLEKSSNDLSQGVNKLYKALQEIREIAKEEIVCEDCNFEGTNKCDARMCTHFYLNDFAINILTKINEVIGAE